jgi:hypothetical protein
MEAIKLLSGIGRLLKGRMLHVNGSEMQFLSIQMKKNTECRICGVEKNQESNKTG